MELEVSLLCCWESATGVSINTAARTHTHTHVLNCDIDLAISNMLPCWKMIAFGCIIFFPAQNILSKCDTRKDPLQLFANVPHSIPSPTVLVYLIYVLPISVTLV